MIKLLCSIFIMVSFLAMESYRRKKDTTSVISNGFLMLIFTLIYLFK